MVEEELTTAVLYGSHPQAVEALATLTEHGIGAVIGAPDPGAEITAYGILVVPIEIERACEILGVAPPGEIEERHKRTEARKRPDWWWALVIFAIAMVVIPVIAFFLSYLVVSH